MPEIDTKTLLEDRFATIEIVGTQKTGKTRSLVTMLNHLDHQSILPKNLYLFDLDGDGRESLLTGLEKIGKQSWIRRPEDGGRLRVYSFNTKAREMLLAPRPTREIDPFISFVNDLNSIFSRLDPRNEWRDPATAPGCVAIDPATSLSEMTWDYILQKRGKELGGSKDQGPMTEDGKTFKWIDPTDWTALQEKIIDCIKTLKSIPCHRVMTFHEELIQEIVPGTISVDKNIAAIQPRSTGQIYNLPLLSGKLQSGVGKFFSVILYSRYYPRQTLNDSYVWVTRPSDNERIKMAGCRSREDLPPQIIQDFCKVLD